MRRIGVAMVTILVVGAMCGGCGYRLSGKADILPRTIGTIAVPAFTNLTNEPALADLLPEAISRELITRTRYQVSPAPDAADAILTGTVSKLERIPTVYDAVTTDPKTGITTGTGRASVVRVSIVVRIVLTERATNKVLYEQKNLEFNEAYQLSPDSRSYFDESGPAIQRLSRGLARSVVAGMLEGF